MILGKIIGSIWPSTITGLDWWTDTKNHFYETYLPVGLHDASPNSLLFPKFVKVVERAKVACYRFKRAPNAVALYLPGNFLALRVVV